jgi:hypothetical protein
MKVTGAEELQWINKAKGGGEEEQERLNEEKYSYSYNLARSIGQDRQYTGMKRARGSYPTSRSWSAHVRLFRSATPVSNPISSGKDSGTRR